MTKHYVEFLFPGIMVAETETKEIKDRNARIVPPKRCYAYRFYDCEQIEENGEVLTGKPKNYSGLFYLGGTVLSREQVSIHEPGSILARNMEYNNIDRVVRTSFGQAFQLYDEDIIITTNSNE